MTFVNPDRQAVHVAGAIVVDADVAERTKDLMVVRLRRQGFSYRVIGRIMGVSHVAIIKRERRIPDAVREHYRRVPLG